MGDAGPSSACARDGQSPQLLLPMWPPTAPELHLQLASTKIPIDVALASVRCEHVRIAADREANATRMLTLSRGVTPSLVRQRTGGPTPWDCARTCTDEHLLGPLNCGRT